jgi:hypothetical protein
MNPESRIKDIIARNLYQYYPELAGSRIKKIRVRDVSNRGIIGRIIGRIIVEQGRFECRAELQGGFAREFFVKKHELAAIEYHRLKELWKYFHNSSEYAIPRVLDYIEEESMIISEKSRGKNFATYLFMSIPVSKAIIRKQQEIEERIKQAAKWLGFFQQRTFKGENEPLDCLRINRLTKELPCLKQNEKNQILNILKNASFLSAPRTACHGLFAPRNMLLTEKGIMVTDWKHNSARVRTQFIKKERQPEKELFYDHCLYDFHYFVQHGLRGLRRFDFMPSNYLARLENIFSNEYAKTSQFDIPEEVVEITRLLFLLDYLHERLLFERLPKKGGYLYRIMHEITKTNWINQIVVDIRDSIAVARSLI